MKNNLTKKQKGFSLLEVIIAVFVLTIGILGVLSLSVNSMSNSIDSRNQVIASNLAQEGVELVRNIRDNNLVKEDSVFEGFPPVDSDNCRIEFGYAIPSVFCDNGIGHKRIYYNNSSGFYVHDAADAAITIFRRRIIFEDYEYPVGSGNVNKRITSMVDWEKEDGDSFSDIGDCNIGSKCVYNSDVLTDW